MADTKDKLYVLVFKDNKGFEKRLQFRGLFPPPTYRFAEMYPFHFNYDLENDVFEAVHSVEFRFTHVDKKNDIVYYEQWT